MSLSSPGVGSGLDIKSLVDALVKAEITPAQTKHDNTLKDVNTELSAVGQLKSTLANLQTSLTKLSDINQFYNMKYSNNNPDFLSASITPQAQKGTYQIEVQQLAQQQTLASTYQTNVGAGTLTINFGTYNDAKTVFTANPDVASVNVVIHAGNDSLSAVADAINNTNSNVSASVVKDDAGSRLTITSKTTGKSYAMKISGSISALTYDPTTGVDDLEETVAAQNSVVKINGLTLSQSSNQLKEAIPGVTLQLKKANPDLDTHTLTTLTVDDNKDQLSALVNDFVKQYNDSITFLTNLTGYNASTQQRGIFQGDPQFRSLKLNLNKWATTPLNNGNTTLKTLADLGITTNQKTGLLDVNQTTFSSALANNYKEIGPLFAKNATATDMNIRVKSVASTVKAGSYNVSLSAFTPGVTLAGTIGDLAASSTNGLTLNGSEASNRISLNILSGATGARGKINVTDGIAVVMNTLLDSYIGDKGDLNERNTQLNNQVKQLTKAQDVIDARSASVHERYLKQFSALDLLMSKMQSTSGYLTQQLSALSQLKINK